MKISPPKQMSLFEASIRRLLSDRTAPDAPPEKSAAVSQRAANPVYLPAEEPAIRYAGGFPKQSSAALSDELEQESRRHTRALSIEGVIG